MLKKLEEQMRATDCAPLGKFVLQDDNQKHRYDADGDRRGDKSGEYILATTDRYAYGFFKNYRTGGYYEFKATHDGTPLTEKEERQRKKDMAKRKKEAKKQKEEEYAAAAIEAKELFDKATQSTDDHPYYVAKGISAVKGVRVNKKNELLMPIWNEHGGMTSYQRLLENGDKLLFKNGKKEGSYFVIADKDDSKDTIVICEGLSTGESIREATGLIVIVAVDCYNLMEVARIIRQKNPESQIIIASDFDQWRKDGNIGYEKAVAASQVYGCYVAHPDVPKDDPDKRTDFNDLQKSEGNEVVKDTILASLPSRGELTVRDPDMPVTGGDPNDTQWEPDFTPMSTIKSEPKNFSVNGVAVADFRTKLLYKTGNFNPNEGAINIKIPTGLHNATVILKENPLYASVFQFNEFVSQVFVTRCPPWDIDNESTFKPKQLDEVDMTNAEAYFEFREGIKCGQANFRRAVNGAARAYSFHPVRDYMKELEWDGTPRLATWLKYYLRAESQSEEYLSVIGTNWLVAGVRRIMQPAAKFDHMLILEGGQGVGKSTALKILATFGRDKEEEFFNDSLNFKTIEERGSILAMQGKIIIEFQELAGFAAKDINELKKWLTVQTDIVEVKFEQFTREHPRQFIVAGTFNPNDAGTYLRDSTGNRRFWPVEVDHTIRFDELKRDREQLWAEAAHLEAQGHVINLDARDPVYAMAQLEQTKRVVEDPWEERIRGLLRNTDGWTIPQLLDSMGVRIEQRTTYQSGRVGSILRKCGWEKGKVKVNGAWVSGFKKPKIQPDMINKDEEIDFE